MQPEESRRADIAMAIGLALVFGVGIFLRVFHFGTPGLWIDEYGTWWTVAGGGYGGDGYGGVFQRAVEIQGQSPFYYLLVRLTVDVCGVAPWSLRLVSLLTGIALIWVGVRLARALFADARVTMAVGATFAANATLIYYSQEARPYSLALLFASLAVWSYISVLRGGGLWPCAALCVSTALTWYSHWLFAVIVLVLICHVVSTRPWAVGTGRRWLALGTITAALMAPGLWQFVTLFGRRASLDWTSSSWSSFASNLLAHVINPWSLAIALALAAALAIFRSVSFVKLEPLSRRLVLLWVATPILVFGVLPPLFGVSLLVTRYTSIVVPAILILVGALLAVVRTGSWHDRLPTCAFLVAVFVGSLWPTYRQFGLFSPRPQDPWHEVAATIEADHRDGDVILYSTGYVELDLVAADEASAATRSFVEFPLLAHLGTAARLPRHALPFGRRPEAIELMNQTLAEVESSPRVWVVGAGKAVDYFLAAFVPLPRVHVLASHTHGNLRALLVQVR